MKGTQISQMTQILTCSVWDFTDDSYSSDFAEESELKPLYSDYALKLAGLDLCGLGQKPHRIGSHRFHRFPQIFLIYAVIGSRGTQILQMTQILTCSVWDFADFG